MITNKNNNRKKHHGSTITVTLWQVVYKRDHLPTPQKSQIFLIRTPLKYCTAESYQPYEAEVLQTDENQQHDAASNQRKLKGEMCIKCVI